MSKNLNFERLMERVEGGSKEALTELIEEYGSHILAVVRRSLHSDIRPIYDSMDFVQAVWASLVRMQDQLDELDTPEKFKAYLAAMARNKMIDESRRYTLAQKNDLGLQEEFDDNFTEDTNPHNTPSQFAMARESLEQLLANEPQRVRRVIEMRREGASYLEIATILNISVKTVQRIMQTTAKKYCITN